MNDILLKYKDYLIARKQSLNYFNVMKIFFDYLDGQKIDYKDITQETITNFYNSRPNYEKSSMTQFIKAGRHFYSQFLEIPKEQNQWYKIRYFKGHKNTPDFLTIEELNLLIQKFCTYENRLIPPVKVRAFFKFAYMTGLRKSEMISVKRKDINLTETPCQIRIIGKGDKERFIYFGEKYSKGLKQELIEYFNSEIEIDNAFNFKQWDITYIFNKMKIYLPNRRIYPHLFRHSFAKYLCDKGIPLSYIQNMLGHSSIQTTMIYLNPTQGQIKQSFL